MMGLIKPNVAFNETEHTYTNADGKQLSGVTALLKRQLFANKYRGIDETTLAKAAERGNLVHRAIEMYETLGVGSDSRPEIRDYIRLKEESGLKVVATEFLVSDEENVASSIDLVCEREGIVITDVKCTSSLDREYLSWQLSIYKYLFLLKNPGEKVVGLAACWLPDPSKNYGSPRMEMIPEKPVEWVKDLIETDARGGVYVNPQTELDMMKQQGLVVPQELTAAISRVLIMEAVAKECKEKLRSLMEEHGIKKWENDDFTATISAASTSTSFDSTAFKKDHKDLYDQYLKTSEKKGSFRVTLKKTAHEG